MTGLTERLKKTIADMLSTYVDMQHNTLYKILPYITFAYDMAIQEKTRFLPLRLVYGMQCANHA